MPAITSGLWSLAALRMVVDVALAMHFAAAAGWWWLSPKGFAFDCSQFWLNSVLPFAVMAISLVGLVAMHFDNRCVTASSVVTFTAAWAAAAIVGQVIFPISLAGVWWLFLSVALAGGAIAFLLLRDERRITPALGACAAFGVLGGLAVVWLEIPQPASTIPLNASLPLVDGRETQDAFELNVGVGGKFYPATSRIALTRGRFALHCSPLLDFDRVSADGFWSLFAPRTSSTNRNCVGNSVNEQSQLIEYDDGSVVLLPRSASNNAGEIVAFTPLKDDVYSHLNSFCVFDVSGHNSLSLTFSPCGKQQIDVLPADYPLGRPARFGYLDSAENFVVVEATSGEKGPFRTLARGRLRRGEPLTLGFHDDGQLMASVTLDDWSSQVSTDFSPTAGWGVPVNSIEFQRSDNNSDAPATIWITLAATSVGRGFETVGYRAGSYRNKLRFQLETPAPE